jgi:hypothetical protein
MNMPFNWFDVFVLLMLLIGYTCGKKNGMSKEALAVLKWIAVMLLPAIAYEPLGLWLSTTANLGKLTSYLIAYVATALIVALIFVLLTGSLAERLKGSDAFGKGEFYLAMPAGILRFGCVVIVLLALLNARYYSTAEVRASEKYDRDNYGSTFFPRLYTVQDDVFKKSFVGSQVHQYLGFLLIKATPAAPGQAPATVKRRDAGF